MQAVSLITIRVRRQGRRKMGIPLFICLVSSFPHISFHDLLFSLFPLSLLPLFFSSPLPYPLLLLPQAPEPIQTGLQFSSDQENRLISLNWSGAFNLNSRLIHYIVSRNSISVQQLQGTQVTLTLEPVGIRKLKLLMAGSLHGLISTVIIALLV